MRSHIKNFSKASFYRASTSFMILIAYVVLYASEWWPLHKQGMGGGHKYGDLSAVINSAHCYREIGRQVYKESGECAFQYGSFLLKFLNFFGIGANDIGAIGLISFVLALLILGGFAYGLGVNKRGLTIALALSLSTGPWLLFERGNFDLLIIFFLVAAVLFLGSRFKIFAYLAIAATVLMKFYTFPLLLVLYLLEKNKYNKIFIAILSLAVLPIVLNDILSASSHPNPTFAAFGILAPGLWINFFFWRFNVAIILGPVILYLIGILTVALGSFTLVKTKLGASWRQHVKFTNKQSKTERNTFLVMTVTFVSCFLAGMNFDYRLTFLIISLLLLNKFTPALQRNKSFIFAELFALWATYFFFGATGPIPVLLAIFGNFAQFCIAIFLIFVLITNYRVESKCSFFTTAK